MIDYCNDNKSCSIRHGQTVQPFVVVIIKHVVIQSNKARTHAVVMVSILYASVYFRAEMSASSQDYKRQIPKLWLWFELLPS